MTRRALLDLKSVSRIKRRLWDGATTDKLAEDFEVSAVTIRAILCGTRWGHVKWPDGSLDAMPEKRRGEIDKARRGVGRGAVEKAVAKLLGKGE